MSLALQPHFQLSPAITSASSHKQPFTSRRVVKKESEPSEEDVVVDDDSEETARLAYMAQINCITGETNA